MSVEELTTILANMTSGCGLASTYVVMATILPLSIYIIIGLTPSSIPTDEEMSDCVSPLPDAVIEDNSVLWLAIAALITIFGGSCVQKSEAFAKCKERMFNRVKVD